MLHAKQDKALKPFYASKNRTLTEAAHAACKIAEAEQLPITATCSDPMRWHCEAILKTVPVYGTRGHRSEQVPATAVLHGERACGDLGEWTDLSVKAGDFQRYIEWLHSIW